MRSTRISRKTSSPEKDVSFTNEGRPMRSLARGALFLCISSALLAQNGGSIFIVRHAEKQSDAEDTAISARGQARADCLARTLHDARIATVIHSQYIRTTQTAAPLVHETHSAEVTVPAKS